MNNVSILPFVYPDKWDESILALLTLLQFIPPAAQGKGKGGRAKIEDARDLVVTFYPVRNNFNYYLTGRFFKKITYPAELSVCPSTTKLKIRVQIIVTRLKLSNYITVHFENGHTP